MKNQTLTRLTLFFVLLGGPSLSIDVMESSTSNTKIETRPATSAKLDVIDKAKPRAAYSNLPLSFEVNQGQTDAKVKFLSRGKGYSLFLTANETVLKLAQPKPDGKGQRTLTDGNKENQETAKTGSILRMNLVGSNPYLQVSGLEELPGKRNYFIGSDPKNGGPIFRLTRKLNIRMFIPE